MFRRSALIVSAALAAIWSTGASADGERIAVFTKNQTNPFFTVVRLGAENAAKQMNAQVIQYVPTKPDSIPEQMSQLEDVVVKKPSAIVFTPVDYKAMTPGIQKVNTAKIPMINMTDRAEQGQFVTFVGSNDFQIGLETGTYLLKAISGKGSVVIIEGVRGTLTNTDRVRGFREALKAFPNVKVAASQTANYQRLTALQVMENLMQTFPQIDGVMAANDSMATGVVEALDGAKRKALVIGINGTKEAIDLIKAGKLLASGDYGPYNQGCFGVMAAVRSLRGLPVPKEIMFPVTVIDKSNTGPFDIAPDKRVCPKWEDVVRGS